MSFPVKSIENSIIFAVHFNIAVHDDVVLSYGWLGDEMLTYMIAVSESTPGPIMVNLATYVGSSQAGFWGALVATTAVVLPSFIIILTALLSVIYFGSRKIRKTGISPISLICNSALAGILAYGG